MRPVLRKKITLYQTWYLLTRIQKCESGIRGVDAEKRQVLSRGGRFNETLILQSQPGFETGLTLLSETIGISLSSRFY